MPTIGRLLRNVGRALLWPIRRFFDPRFQGLARQDEVQHKDLVQRIEVAEAGIHERIDQRHDQTAALVEETRSKILEAVDVVLEDVRTVKGIATAEMDAAADATELIGRSLADLLGEVERLSRRLDLIQQRLDENDRESERASRESRRRVPE
jgi:hypothetical protein